MEQYFGAPEIAPNPILAVAPLQLHLAACRFWSTLELRLVSNERMIEFLSHMAANDAP